MHPNGAIHPETREKNMNRGTFGETKLAKIAKTYRKEYHDRRCLWMCNATIDILLFCCCFSLSSQAGDVSKTCDKGRWKKPIEKLGYFVCVDFIVNSDKSSGFYRFLLLFFNSYPPRFCISPGESVCKDEIKRPIFSHWWTTNSQINRLKCGERETSC